MGTDAIFGLVALLLTLTTTVLWFRDARAVNIPTNRSPYVMAWFVALAFAAAALLGAPGLLGGGAAIIAALGSGLLLLTVAISQQKLPENAIRVGDQLPAFTALDEHGNAIDSTSLAGQSLLLKFFRGHW